MNAKIVCFCIFSHLAAQVALAEGGLTGGLGLGQHFPYQLKSWKGKEQLVSRLSKGDLVYEFVRVSKDEFLVRKGGDKGETYFRFNTNFNDGGVILENGRLIDVYKAQDTISALMYGESGYFLVVASSEAPKLEKGQIYIIPKPIRVDEWHRTFVVLSTDYYQRIGGVHYPLSDKVASAKLVGERIIQLVHNDPNGKQVDADQFTFKEDLLLKNGNALRKVIVSDYIGDEKVWLESLASALNDKNQRAAFIRFYDKDELLMALSNASHKSIYGEFSQLVDGIYAETKK